MIHFITSLLNRENVRSATEAIRAHKLRSGLTVLGILVGVFSIILVMTALRGLQTNIESELRQMGAQSFVVQKWPEISFEGPIGWDRIRRRKNLTFELGERLRDKATMAASVGQETYFTQADATSRYAKTNPNVGLLGMTAASFSARNWVIEQGRALLEADLEGARHVCVLGNSLAKKLFPQGSSLGERVKFDGIYYSVIGVLEGKGSAFGGDQDNFLVIPLTTGWPMYGSPWRSLSFMVQAPNENLFTETIEQVRAALRVLRRVAPGAEDDFEIYSNDSLIRQFRSLTRAVRIGAAAVSSIALIAAGIGIMNIMLVSVTERTREIGIRRAVGAKKRDILGQFLLEALVLCQIGGWAGIVLGVLGGNLAGFFLDVKPLIPVDWVILGFAICCLVGVVFGTYPAWKAAQVDPIESLRYE